MRFSTFVKTLIHMIIREADYILEILKMIT